ncbi:MAG: biotin--[acetyl-CoA-carboxylase] ligase [Terracidiphilus sp.]|jgi:BirA family biotin operon repressor/biotin-[acetyl-CoA-carboxylase] ligase
MFDLAALEAELACTLFAGKLHFSRVTGSTNSDAVAAARLGAPHGSVYFSDEQLSGRGRDDHAWISAVGEGLYVSVLLRPQIPAARLAFLPLAAGLAAADAIRAVSSPGPAPGLGIDLRWPNDLLIGPRKTGGILVEAGNDSKGLPYAVVGIGINVHQRAFPPDLATPATSLDLETNRHIARQALLPALLKSLQQEALALANSDAAREIAARVEKASTWVCGRRVEVHGPQACSGVTAGLDENGFLRVTTADGIVTVQTGGLREKPAPGF